MLIANHSRKYLEIAFDREHHSKIMLNLETKELEIHNHSQHLKQITLNKIKAELKLFKSHPEYALVIHRRIRNILGMPDCGLGIYPILDNNKQLYIPKVLKNKFDFSQIQRNPRNKPNILVKSVSVGICQSDRRVMLGTKTSNFDKE